MRSRPKLAAAVLALASAACTGQEAVLVGNTILVVGAAANPPVLRAVDGIKEWKRHVPPERYAKDGLYGYIDGGAELVLSYGFRELSVFTFKPAGAPAAAKEIILEIYRMTSGTAAFGLYSTKLDGRSLADLESTSSRLCRDGGMADAGDLKWTSWSRCG